VLDQANGITQQRELYPIFFTQSKREMIECDKVALQKKVKQRNIYIVTIPRHEHSYPYGQRSWEAASTRASQEQL
jgi:hypothetical protein